VQHRDSGTEGSHCWSNRQCTDGDRRKSVKEGGRGNVLGFLARGNSSWVGSTVEAWSTAL
jgi:hypothetical protein